jgi:hypothetical protein
MEADWTKIVAYNIRLETDLRTRSQSPRALAAHPNVSLRAGNGGDSMRNAGGEKERKQEPIRDG